MNAVGIDLAPGAVANHGFWCQTLVSFNSAMIIWMEQEHHTFYSVFDTDLHPISTVVTSLKSAWFSSVNTSPCMRMTLQWQSNVNKACLPQAHTRTFKWTQFTSLNAWIHCSIAIVNVQNVIWSHLFICKVKYINHGDRETIFGIFTHGFYSYDIQPLNDDITAIELS